MERIIREIRESKLRQIGKEYDHILFDKAARRYAGPADKLTELRDSCLLVIMAHNITRN